jgi:hypothetical protein
MVPGGLCWKKIKLNAFENPKSQEEIMQVTLNRLTITIISLIGLVFPMSVSGPAKGTVVNPSTVNMSSLPNYTTLPSSDKQIEYLYSVDSLTLEQLRQGDILPFSDPSFQVYDQVDEGNEGFVPVLLQDFEGIAQTAAEQPPDPIIAVGQEHIMALTNFGIQIFDRNGNTLQLTTPEDFFNEIDPPGIITDPKIIYDSQANRWVLLYLSHGSAEEGGYYLLSVSETSDPLGNWQRYLMDATLNGDTPSDYWADFPGLGIDTESIYITSNQFTFGADPEFQYAKIRILSKSGAYDGQPLTWTDFWNIVDNNNQTVFTIKPVSIMVGSSGMFLVNIIETGGDYVNLWKIDNPLDSPSLNLQTVLSIQPYSIPPNADNQPGVHNIDMGKDCRTQEVILHGDYLYTAFTTGHDWGEGPEVTAIRILKVNTITNSVDIDRTFGLPGYFYYYPALEVDPLGDIALVCNRSSGTEFVGIRWVYKRYFSSDYFGQWLKNGEGAYVRDRWGDYSGAALDLTHNGKIWIYGEYAQQNGQWGTRIGEVLLSSEVEFRNDIEGQNAGGSLLLNAVEELQSGDTKLLAVGSNNTVKTLNQVFNDWQNSGHNYQHHDWNNEYDERFFSHIFYVEAIPEQTQSAEFQEIYSIPIRMVDEQTNIIGHELQIQDPWLINPDLDERYETPVYKQISPHDEWNIFIGQDPTSGPAYYFKAPGPLYANTTAIYEFDHWEVVNGSATIISPDDLETAVVFYQGNTTIQAVYQVLPFNGEIVIDADLDIPAGARYDVYRDFRFRVIDGRTFRFLGTREDPIEIKPIDYPSRTEPPTWDGIYVPYGSLRMENTVLRSATVGIDAHLTSLKQVQLYHNTFVYNDTAVRVTRTSGNPEEVLVTNNLFVHNQTDTHPALLSAEVRYNLFYDNPDGDIVPAYDYMVSETNNYYNHDPLFVNDVGDETGDFHLQVESYAINGGDPDFDGDGVDYQTDSDDQDPDGTRLDLGAYYYDSPPDNPPYTPTGFYLSGPVGQPVTLHWNLNDEHDIVGYRIYRRLTDSQRFYLLRATVGPEVNTYTDNQVTVASGGGGLTPEACYRIAAFDLANQASNWTDPDCVPYNPFKTMVQTEPLPDRYALHGNYPNPFNPKTTLRYDLPENSRVKLMIYDLMGRAVRTLVQGEETAGFKQALWNGTDDAGRLVAAGVYLYTFQAVGLKSGKQFSGKGKLVLLK